MKTNISKWVEAIKENKFSSYGIRWIAEDESYNISDIARNSYEWDIENDISTYETDEPVELDGTCAIELVIDRTFDEDDEIAEAIEEVLKNRNGYYGTPVLLGSDRYEYGNDNGEIIMEDAKVIAK